MAIATEEGVGGAPFAKFMHVGDTLIGAFASEPKACQQQVTNYDTKQPVFKDSGKPQLEEVLWLVAMPGTTVGKGNRETGLDQIEPLSVVRFAVSGYKWKQVIDARKALPAANGFRAGQACSGDVYTIELVGWSAETKNPAAAQAAGFTVVDGRIVLRSDDEKVKYVVAQVGKGGNANPAYDYAVTIRRPTSADKAYEQAADALYLEKPWTRTAQLVGAGAPAAPPVELDDAF